MAYKFQLGAAILSGSIQAEDGIVSTDVDDATAANIVAQIDDKEIAHTKVALESGDLLIGDASGVAQNQTLSGDVTLTAAGAVTIANDAVTLAKMADLDAGNFIIGNAGNDPTAVSMSGEASLSAAGALVINNNAITQAKLADDAVGAAELASDAVVNDSVAANAAIAHSKLAGVTAASILMGNSSGVATATAVSGELTLTSAGALSINANAVSNAKMADDSVGANELIDNSVGAAAMADDAIETAFIADDQVTYAKVQNVSAAARILGRNTPGAGDVEEVTPAQLVGMFNSDLGGNFTIGNQSSDTMTLAGGLTIGGDLLVSGNTVEIDAAFTVTSSVKFEGATPNDHEIELTSADPSADRTITLPDLDGHVPLLAGAIGSANVTAAEFALLDGASSVGTTSVATGHGIMMNQGGTMAHTSVATLSSFQASDGLAQVSGKLEVSLNTLGASMTSAVQADSLAMIDSANGNVTKKITFSNFEDQIFGNITGGDVHGAASGVLTIQANAVEGSMLNDNAISGQAELAAGGVADEDEIMISDGGVLKRIGVDNFRSFVQAGAAPTAFGDANATLAFGVNFASANPSTDRTLTLPATPSVGQSVKVKAPADMSGGTFIITKDPGTSHQIDGASLITLESPFAAVELVYVASNAWRVF